MKKGIFSKKSWKKWVSAALTLTLVFNAGLPGQIRNNKVSAAGSDKVIFTDFEYGSTGYTAGSYGNSITRDAANVREGKQALQYVQSGGKQWGNAFNVRSVSGSAIDVSAMTKIVINVKDTQGTNTVPVKLIDESGKSSEVYTGSAVKDTWTQLSIPLTSYNSEVNRKAIKEISIYEWGDGTYYFDDIHFEDDNGHRADFQDFEKSLYYDTNSGTNKLTSSEKYSGSTSLLYNQGTNGGGGVAVIDPGKIIDASGKAYIALWMKDTTGNNNFELELTDADGNSVKKYTDDKDPLQVSLRDQWKKIIVPLKDYSGIDTGKIKQIKIYEYNAGNYYIDDIYFTNTLPPAAPVADKEEGNYSESFEVKLTAPEGGTIYYTTDEMKPTDNSTEYTAPIIISANTVLKAVVIKDGESSNVLTLNYTIIPSSLPKKAVFANFEDEGAIAVTGGTIVSTEQHGGGKSVQYDRKASAMPDENSSVYVSAAATDASSYNYLVFWLKDTQGSNGAAIELVDAAGKKTNLGWAGTLTTSDGNAVKDTWTEYAVKVSSISGINNINRAAITGIYIGEWNTGIYYIDDIYFTNELYPAAPVASLASGTYANLEGITLAAASGCDIYYTTDGTIPAKDSGTSKKYEGALSFTAKTTLKAIAVRESGGETETSKVSTYSYTVSEGPAPTKVIFENFEGDNVKIKNGTLVSTEKYNGSKSAAYTLTASADPSKSSSFYVEGTATDTLGYTYLVFWLKDTQGSNDVKLGLVDKSGHETGLNWAGTLTTSNKKAVKNTWTEYAVELDKISGIGNVDRTAIEGIYIGEWNSGTYYIDDVYFTKALLPATPTSSYTSGTYEKLEGVTLTTTTAGCDIYYTTDGSTPTTDSYKYVTPLTFTEDTVVKAAAIRQSDSESSAVAAFTYHVKALPASGVVSFNNFDDGTGVTAQTGAKITFNGNDTYGNKGKSVTYDMSTLSGSPTETVRSITVTPQSGTTADVRLSKYLVFYVKDKQAYNNTRMFIKDEFGNEASAWTTCSTMYDEWSMYYVDLSTMSGFSNLDLAFMKEVTFGFYNTGTYLIDEMYFTDKLYTGLPGAETPALNPAAGEVLASRTPGTYDVFVPVELAAETGADIYYTTDGTVPTTSSKKYSGAIYIKAPAVIQAVSVKDSVSGSVFSFEYNIKPGKPVAIFGEPGTYTGSVIVALRSSEDNTPVYYTLDGSEPTTSSILYNSPFRIEETTTLKAMGYNNMVASDVKTFEYIIQGTEAGVKAPKSSLPAGIYGGTRTLALTSGTDGAQIHYTTDGTTPTALSQVYAGEITISANTTLKAIAVKEGKVSGISEYQYTIKTGLSNFLKADGKKIRNNYGTGDEVILRGSNAGGWLVTENWQCPLDAKDMLTMINVFTERFGQEKAAELIKQYQDNWWTSEDFDLVKAEGMNILRLPITYFEMLNDDGSLKTTAFERLDWFISEAKKRDIYVMIDMHGAVGSQNGKDHSGDITIADIGNFYGNEENINKTIALWEEIAKRYKNEPMVCGYDLLNEPSATKLVQYDVYDRIYKAIRAIDKDHIIYLQAIWNPADMPDPSLYGWENVVYQYHFYNWSDLTDSKKQSDFIKDKIKLINTANYNVPSFIGEFTFFSNPESWTLGMNAIEEAGLSYTTWTFKVSDGGEGSSWGLYTGKSNPVLVNTDSFETIVNKWSTIDTTTGFTRNAKFADVLKTYFTKNTALAVPYSEPSNETPDDGNGGSDDGNNGNNDNGNNDNGNNGNNDNGNNDNGNSGNNDNGNNGNNDNGNNDNGNSNGNSGNNGSGNSANGTAAIPTVSDTQVKDGKAIITMSLSQAELKKAAEGKDKLIVSVTIPESDLAAQLKEGRDTSIRLDLTSALSISNVEVDKVLLTSNLVAQIAAAQKSVDVTVVLKDGTLNWHFDGELLKASKRPVTDINLMGRTSVVTIAGSTANQKGLVISFNHSGLLSSTAIITLSAETLIKEAGLTAGSKAFVYYREQAGGKLLEIPNNQVTVGSDGTISVPITHCSDYVILAKKPDKSLLVSLLDQIKISSDKEPLYVNGTTGSTKTIKVTLSVTLVKAGGGSLKDTGIETVEINYASSDKSIAAVDKNGKVTGKKAGKAIITLTAKLADGTSRTVKTSVTVKNAWVEVVKAPGTIKYGKSGSFSITLHGFKNSDITWKTLKKGIAIVGANSGKTTVKVTGSSAGKDTLVILSKGKKIKSITVTVSK